MVEELDKLDQAAALVVLAQQLEYIKLLLSAPLFRHVLALVKDVDVALWCAFIFLIHSKRA